MAVSNGATSNDPGELSRRFVSLRGSASKFIAALCLEILQRGQRHFQQAGKALL